MKKIVATLLLFMSFISYSQTNGITYQALIINPSGEELPGVNNINAPLTNKNICLKFSILNQSSQFEYIETVQTTTDEFGMVNLIIGTGDQIGGYASSFSTILWNANPKSLKVDLSTTGICSYYTEISNQPFTAVPFALFAATAGTPGTPGPAGPQGIQGVAGPTGATGAIGPVGPQGAQGLPGTNGTNGVDGAVGAPGPQGLQGIQGVAGPAGATGATGSVGPQGAQGLAGTNGTNGVDGVDGAVGATGSQGIQGAVGPQGDQGLQGIQGVAGPAGADGLQGMQGIAGIQGEVGPRGDQGLQGIQGVAGPIGADGPQGVPGSDATVTIGTISTSSDPKGATITAGELKLAPADAFSGGIVTTGNQTFGGSKTFGERSYFDQGATFNGIVNGQLNMLDLNFGPFGRLNHDGFMLDIRSFIFRVDADFMDLFGDMHVFGQVDLLQDLNVNGNTISNSFIKRNGLSTEFLKADGSVDNATYLTATGTAANVSGVVAIANGGTAATTAAEALINLGAAPIDSPTFTGVPLAPTPINTTNTTQIATTAFIQDLLLNAPTSSSSTLSGAIWTSATTGTLNGIGFTVGAYTMSSNPPSLLNSDYSTADYASNPLSATQETSYFMSGSSWTVTFNSPISNLKLYVYWRASGIGGSSFYRFDQAFSIASGSTGMTNSGNDLNISGWGKGILEFSGPITTLTLSADGTSCCSGHTMTFASGVGGIASASGTGQVIRIDSPNLEGIPTAPTAAPGTNTTQIATTAFVTNAVSAATNGGATSVGAISSSSDQNGASINAGVLNLAPADASNGGIVTTGTQTFAGAKTFSDGLTVINKPFLPTKLNQSQISSLSSVEEGMVVYNTDTRKLQIFSVGNTDTTNELYSGNFSTERDMITQSFVPQVSGSVYAFQFFAKKVITNNPMGGNGYLVVDYPGGSQSVDLTSLTTSGEWISINLPTPISVVAGASYNFSVWSFTLCLGKVILGTNSNYSNGSIINSYPGCDNPGALNGDDLMFRVLITPSSTSAYWLNLN